VSIVRESLKFSGQPYMGAHCAVIFAIAQLFCHFRHIIAAIKTSGLEIILESLATEVDPKMAECSCLYKAVDGLL